MARRYAIPAPPVAACKTAKASRKKLAKVERVQRRVERSATVTRANAELDLLAGLDEFRAIRVADGTDVRVESARGPGLGGDLDKCAALLASNMQALYTASGWGWDDQAKRDGLSAADSRLLLLFAPPPAPPPAAAPAKVEKGDDADGWVLVDHPVPEETGSRIAPPAQPFTTAGKAAADAASEAAERGDGRGELIGFVHLQFCVEGEKPVLYVLEMQLAPAARSLGLGKHAMGLVERIARKAGMCSLMLTVFKSNTRALSFYREKLRYAIDETSPSKCGSANATYEILSKEVAA